MAKDRLIESQGDNPSERPATETRRSGRIPMTNPTRKLEVPKIPGYYLQWIRGDDARIQQAKNAGFEFVAPEDVNLNPFGLGDDQLKSGNTDMGSLVSVADSSDVGPNAQPIRAYLMKQREEYHEEDLQLRQRQNDSVADALTASFNSGQPAGSQAPGETGSDRGLRYVDPARTKIPDLFKRKVR